MEQTQKGETSIQKNLISIFLLSYITILFSYFLRLIYGNSLTTQEFGILFSIIAFTILISFIFSLGLSESFNYFGVRYFEDKNYTNLKQILMYTLTIQTILSIITFVVIFFLSDFLLKNYFKIGLEYKVVLFLVLLSTILFSLIRTFNRFFIVEKNFFLAETLELLSITAILIPSLILFFKGTASLTNYSILRFFPLLPIILILPIIIRKHFPILNKIKLKPNKKLYSKFTTYSLTLAISILSITLLSKLDVFFITMLMNVKNVAFYETAFITASIIQAGFLFIPTLLFPYFSSLHNKKKNLQLNTLITQTYKLVLPLLIPILIIFLIFPKTIIITLFQEEFFYTKELLQILSIGMTIFLLQQLNFTILSSIGKTKERNKILVIGLIMNIVLNYILISTIGLIGAAIATTTTIILMFILSIIAIKKNQIKVKISKKYTTKLFLSTIIFFSTLYTLTKIIERQNIIQIFIILLTSLIVYYIVLRIFKILTLNKLLKLLNFKIPEKIKWIKNF